MTVGRPIRTAMVLAAGLGLRMRPLTLDRPKPLIDIAGRALIDRALDRLVDAGVERVVVNTHYLGAQLAAHLAQRAVPHILLSHEAELLETGGGVVRALSLLGDEPFFVVNADSFWLDGRRSTLLRLAEAWRGERMDALLLLARAAGALGYDGAGDYFADQNGRLKRRRVSEVAPFVFAGVQILDPRALAGRGPDRFSLNRVWDALEREDRLFGQSHDGLWFHIGTPDERDRAEAFLRERRLAIS